MQAAEQEFAPQNSHRQWVGVLAQLQSQPWKLEMGDPRSQLASKTRLAEPYQQDLGLNERPCLKDNNIESNQRKSKKIPDITLRLLQAPAHI